MDLVIDTLDYKGVHLDFYQDPPSRQIYTIFNNTKLFFGIDNTLYHEDAKKLIDYASDLIGRVGNTNCLLKYFNNAGNRDIMLLRGKRILKVYLIDPISNIDDIKRDALFVAIMEEEKAKTLSLPK